MNPIRRKLVIYSVRGFLRMASVLCRADWRGGEQLMDQLGRFVAWRRKVQPTNDPEELGRIWQRAFPFKKQIPITHIEGNTAFGEIHTPCPLRGSGDTQACFRMMAYDRAFMAEAGAVFEVLETQATPGVTVCKVAMRPASAPQ